MTLSLISSTNSTGAPNRLGLPDIALVGKAGSGKTTAAETLFELLDYKRLSFAAALRKIACMLWGSGAATDREKLQRLGVAVRDIAPDTWVDQLLQDYHSRFGPVPIVIDDCRFPNEWWALKGEGFVVVRIEAPLSLRVDRLKRNGKWQNESQLDHVSETAIDHLVADYTIENDDELRSLEDELLNVVVQERKRR